MCVIEASDNRNGERILVTGAMREKSSREKQRNSLGARRRDEAAERSERGTEWVKGHGKKREKCTSVANESRDDWFAYSRYARTVCFHLLSRSRLPLFPVLSSLLPFPPPHAFISLRAVQFIPHSRTVRTPMATTFNKYRINAFTARRTVISGSIQTSRRHHVKFADQILTFYHIFSREKERIVQSAFVSSGIQIRSFPKDNDVK